MSRSPFPPLGRSRRRARLWRQASEWVLRPLCFAGAVAVILAATTWPWSSFVGHPHWGNVRLLPWTIITKPWEPLANVLLFMPLGVAVQWSPTRDRRWMATFLAAALSLAVEGFQLYTHTRIPAVPDVVVNTMGGWLGAQAALWVTGGVGEAAGLRD